MASRERKSSVFIDLPHTGLARVGTLFIDFAKGHAAFSFEFCPEWLSGPQATLFLDPDLKPISGRQYPSAGKMTFGAFSDSTPDRWGRLLMRRREAQLARVDGRKPRALSEADYLFGVDDRLRMGALRLADVQTGSFLAPEDARGVPALASLRALEEAARGLRLAHAEEEERWLSQILAPGSSLGGSRPKANVTAPDGTLWIAKFPSHDDEWDVGAWESVVCALARDCGLSVAATDLRRLSAHGSTFLSRRFDRSGQDRVHFMSAMCALGQTDGSHACGYLDMADFLARHGARPAEDTVELWRRAVFNMIVSNTDDHLRNHGFLLTPQGWRLSPLYDVNPCIYGESLAIPVDDADASIDLSLALEAAPLFGVSPSRAKQAVLSMCDVVERGWRDKARQAGLGSAEISRMEPAFDMSLKNKPASLVVPGVSLADGSSIPPKTRAARL